MPTVTIEGAAQGGGRRVLIVPVGPNPILILTQFGGHPDMRDNAQGVSHVIIEVVQEEEAPCVVTRYIFPSETNGAGSDVKLV